ncbi:hypothetical protein C2G38_2021147 [Gigaspora rosea]|uniref:RRM domain-containing protein n=1 Tax=Gigaspora rosea TaxID=44941 RepID=A0A397ULN3_9GLOM|nr:hypothetical protein C2G38_2021147 [Gigaspora rosea]
MAAPPSATVYGAPPAFGHPQPGISNISKQPPCTTPNNTIYINNLNEKIKLTALKNALKAIFEQYGEILEISARDTLRMRGQAFVVFKEQESAINAVKGVQGFALHGKPMVIQFARTKSDAIAMLDGTIEEHKRLRQEAKASMYHFGHQVPATGNIPDEYLPPNNILFLQNLPGDITGAVLTSLFEQYSGFKEVRSIHPAKGIAFVEYDSEPQAMIAKEALTNHLITPDHKLKITYAKK